MYSLIIWDFNGTILDDVEVGIKSVNVLLERRGLPILKNKEEYRKVFGFPIIEYYKRLGFDFEKESYDVLAKEWVNEYLRLVPEASIKENVKNAIIKIKENGVKQIILSATEQKMLEKQVNMLGISEYFDGVYGAGNIYAYGKEDVAKKISNGENAVVIGDTEHDVEVARLIGADCFILKGGHQNRSTLEKMGVPIIDNTEILEKVIPRFA